MLHLRLVLIHLSNFSSCQSPPLPIPTFVTSNVPSSCARSVLAKRSNFCNVPNSIMQIPFPSLLLRLLPYLPLQNFTIASEVALPPVRSPPDSLHFPLSLLNPSQLRPFSPQTQMIPATRYPTGLSVSLHQPANPYDTYTQNLPSQELSLSSGPSEVQKLFPRPHHHRLKLRKGCQLYAAPPYSRIPAITRSLSPGGWSPKK